MSTLIEVKNLSVDFQSSTQKVKAVDNVSFTIRRGQTVGLVGESGSGKSVTALSIMRLIATPPGKISSGQIFLDQKDLLKLPEQGMRKIRGNRISMIFQEPMSSLNPVFTIGSQISEVLILHRGMSKKEATNRSVELLKQVEVDNPVERIKAYPHQLSGGQRQRVMIAMAIACQPDLLIADEPTTALDVTIQKQIMELLKNLQKKYSMSILFISHNLSLMAQMADYVLVMYRGQIVEQNETSDLFQNPKHPYTKGLIHCRPMLDSSYSRLPVMSDYMDNLGKEIIPDPKKWGKKKVKHFSLTKPLLEVRNLKKYFPLQKTFFGKVRSWIKAVDDVSFTIRRGQTVGLVGESGSGKTTLGRVILRLVSATEGEVLYEGADIMKLTPRKMRLLRKKMQVIFQDPYASLNPRMTIGSALMEPMVIHHLGQDLKARLREAGRLMERVGLNSNMLNRYPHEFSGGQRQRICIARALAVQPDFIICDESVSALDVSVQAQIINLLLNLKEELNLTYIFISHDLAVVKFISDDICVMKHGKIVEQNSPENIYKNPKNPYTKTLLNSIPSPTPPGKLNGV